MQPRLGIGILHLHAKQYTPDFREALLCWASLSYWRNAEPYLINSVFT